MKKMIFDNQKGGRRFMIWGIPTIVVVILMVVCFFQFKEQNKQTIQERNEKYIEDFTLSLAEKLNESFSNAQTVVRSMAVMNVQEVMGDTSMKALAKMETAGQFDHVRFVDADGISHTTSGNTADVSDRSYFIEGMKGNSGTTFVTTSRLTDQRQVGFYAPVENEGEIVGVLVAFYNEKTLRKSLEYYFYGEQASAGIIDQNGTMIVNAPSKALEAAYSNGYSEDASLFVQQAPLTEECRSRMIQAYTNCTPTAFQIEWPSGDVIGYIAPLESVGLSVYMTFPAAASTALYTSGEEAGIRLQTSLIIIFSLFAAYLILVGFIKLSRERTQNKLIHQVAEAENAVSRGVIVLNLEEGTYVNPYALEIPISRKGSIASFKEYLYKISEEDYIGKEEIDRFLDEDIPSWHSTSQYPSIILKRDGQFGAECYYSMTFVPSQDSTKSGRRGVILFRDVTAQTRKEQLARRNLLNAAQAAETANKAKTTFLFNMSHDIRTPMNAIIGFADLLEKNLDDPKKAREYLEKMRRSSEFLLSLINNVLEMARIESGRMTLDETTWSTEQFNDALFSVFEEQMRAKNITFTRTMEVQHKYVFCDRVKLREIFLNVLSNAYKYTAPGGHVTMCLKEIPSEDSGVAMFQTTITDDGMGMDKEFLAHVFDEFSREKNSTDSGIEGTGLGMPIVKKLVELMHGTITIDSELGKGTTVVVTIPHPVSSVELLDQVANAQIMRGVFAGKRILLAEDNELNAEIAEEFLSDEGIAVEVACDGARCVEMLRQANAGYYDLILMDIQMPNMNGYEATRAIRAMADKEKAYIPIIAMTANAFDEDKMDALEAGMNDHVAKPVEMPKLMQAFSKIWG